MGASLAIGVILSLAGASPVGGQTADGSAEARGVAQAVTAAELAAWGRAHRDPGALIMAARLTDEINMRQGPDSDAGPLLSAETLLDEAAAMAPDDAPVQAAVAHLRDGPARRGVRASPFGRGPPRSTPSIWTPAAGRSCGSRPSATATPTSTCPSATRGGSWSAATATAIIIRSAPWPRASPASCASTSPIAGRSGPASRASATEASACA
jgi:hypothetical protein